MKKLWKPMLSVLLSICLIVGWLALPASAAGTTTVTIGGSTKVLDMPPIEIPFVPTDFNAAGKSIKSGNLFNELAEEVMWANSIADIDIGIVNNTGVPLKYDLDFWMDWVLVDRADKQPEHPDGKILDQYDVFAPGHYSDPAPNGSGGSNYPYHASNLALFNYFDSGALMFPHVFYVEKFVDKSVDRTVEAPPVISGNEDISFNGITNPIMGPKHMNGPFKSFNMQGSGPSPTYPSKKNMPQVHWHAGYTPPPLGPAEFDSLSGTLAAAAGSSDDYLLHFAEPYEIYRFEMSKSYDARATGTVFDDPVNSNGSGRWTTGHFPAIDTSGWSLNNFWWDMISDIIGGTLVYRLLVHYEDINGEAFDDTETYGAGGIALNYRIPSVIEATIPQYKVEFYKGAAMTPANLHTSWTVNPNISLEWLLVDDKDRLVPADIKFPAITALPDPGPFEGNAFLYWEYYNGTTWVKVTNSLAFSPSLYGVSLNGAGTLYETLKLRAVYDEPATDQTPVKVQVVINGETVAGTPFVWESSDELTVEEKLILLGLLKPLEGTEEGKKLMFYPKGKGGPAYEVGEDTINWINPASYDLTPGPDGIYTFVLYAEYQGKDTLVRFFLDDGTTATRTPYIKPGETTPYEVWVQAYDTVASQTGTGKAFPTGLPTPGTRADGCVFDGWEYIRRDWEHEAPELPTVTPAPGEGGAVMQAIGDIIRRIAVAAGFQFDPRLVARDLPKRSELTPPLTPGRELTPQRDNDYYVCDLYAKYKAPPGPDDCDFPWWLLPLGGIGLLGAGGVAIAGMTLPWLIALPLLPVLLLLGGKIIKDRPAKQEIITPPKTGEGGAWELLPLAGIGLAGAWLVVLRRRREEEVLA